MVQLRDDIIEVGESRLNFYLATVTASLIGAAVASANAPPVSFWVGIVVGLALLVFGVLTFARMVDRQYAIQHYSDAANQARMLAVSVDDEDAFKPLYVRVRSFGPIPIGFGLPATVTVVNAAVAAVGAVVLARPAAEISAWQPAVGGALVVVFLHVVVWVAGSLQHRTR